jgi:hypothetical protein
MVEQVQTGSQNNFFQKKSRKYKEKATKIVENRKLIIHPRTWTNFEGKEHMAVDD